MKTSEPESEKLRYKDEVNIDESALDVCWLKQPDLMQKYGRNAAQMQRLYDKAEEKLELCVADLDAIIRKTPEAYGIDRISEERVKQAIKLVPEWKQANDALIEARYELNVARAVVKSFDHRRDALEHLVKLHGLLYFAGPRVPRDLTKEWQKNKSQENNDAEVAAAVRRRRS
jgi:hypothetical protein